MKTSQRASLLRYVWFIVLLCCGQQAFAQAPTITSVVPLTGPEKRNVTINGSNFFGGAVTSRTLRLNGVIVQIQSVSANRIVFTVPAGATTGPINVQTNLGSVTTPSDFVVAPGAPPANDSFSTPQLLTGASGFFDGNTANATKELGEPDHAGVAGGASVWFSWTAPSSGPFLFNPNDATTNFGVNLAVYTGTALNNLVPVTSAFAGISTTRYKSAVAFNATAGVTYLIALDGFNGIMGDFRLTWSPLAPPTATTFTPSSGYAGQSFTITGTGFTPTTQVIVGGVAVSTGRVTVNSPTSILVSQIPYPAATGPNPITLINLAGSGTSTGNFNVLAPPAPAITTFSPSSGAAGTTTVSFTGTALSLGDGAPVSISFNGAYANPVTVTSGSSVSAKVPSGATTGPITIQTPAGSASTSTNFTVTSSYLPPVVFGLFPSVAAPGATISITGQNFYGATSVLFNGVSAAFTFDKFGQVITATVPAGATSGPVTVVNPAGSATSSTSFTVTPPLPTISGFSPTTITFGSSVVITGANLTSANSVSFNGVPAASFTVDSSSQITAVVPAAVLTDGPISVTTPLGSATSVTIFSFVLPPPTISDFSPTFITNGNTVSITGTNFYNVQGVAFNGTPAASFSVESSTQIAAVVPAGSLTDGPVSVTTAGGTASSSTSFTYAAQPAIASFSPATISSGQSVVITGSGFSYVTSVGFNGVPAASFVVDSSTQITAIVPAGPLTNGPLTVTTMVGTATSAASFTYFVPPPVPTITSFSPAAIAPGLIVPISGTNFVAVTSVRFNGLSASSFTVSSPTQITATVPTGVTAGAITVITANGTATSPTNYTVTLAPIINGITTTGGPEKRIITVSGANYSGTGISGINPRFNGLSVGSFSVGPNTLTFAVPVGATTGPITIQTNQGLATSPFNFTVINSGPPPANDNFLNAQVISGPSGFFNGNNVYATKESGEPNHANNPGGASVWFSWTAPQSGLFLFSPNPLGSQFGITQSIYTGGSVSTLTQVASGLTPPNIFARYGSAAVLNAVAGTTYSIALDGFNGVMADFRLTWSPLGTPLISSFSPSSATAGQTVSININGSNFTPGAPVSFGGGLVDSTKITYQSQTLITVTQVPITAVTGPITVVTPAGTATSAAIFNVTPPPAPTIAGFTPDVGSIGTTVTINGTNFAGTSAVRFNGTAATSFTVAANGQSITTAVPIGASAGLITVVAPGGTATSATPFTVASPPVIAQQPQPQTTTYGQSATFTVTATSVLPLSYDWRKNGVSIGSANPTASTASLVISPATMADAAAYDCVVTNALGSVVSTTATLTVNPAPATVTLAGLTATYDGSPKPVTVTTDPSGLSVQILYDNSPTVPTNAGPHQVVAIITDPNYFGFTGAYLTINKAPAAMSLTDLTATYNGSPRTATVTTVPAGLNVSVTYAGSPAAPTNAGNYAVAATINDPNYSGSIAGMFTIAKASATVTLGNLATTYDGTAKSATVTTAPASLAASVTYDGSATSPTNAGSYAVAVTVTDPNYTGSASGTLAIAKAVATVSLGNLSQTYDGTAKSATVATAPANVATAVTYDGNAPAPTNAGSYAVAANVTDPNYTGSASATLVIGKAAASVALGGLAATYDTTPHAATATTSPASLNVSLTYDGSATAPTNAGSYAVAATINDNNYAGSISGTLSIAKAAATVSLGSLAQTYDGSPKSASVATTPLGVATAVTYDGNTSVPTNAGSYAVAANVTDPNYTGSAAGSLTIAKAAASITLGNLAQIYDGSPKSVTATTSPAGLGVALTYDGNATPPTNAGSYAVAATVTNVNYSGSANGVLVIAKGAATIALANLVQPYNGQPRVVSTSTTPAGLNVNVTYDGSTDAPTNPGSYAVVATIADANRAGTVSGTLVVGITALVRHAPTISGGLDGSLQILLGENVALGGNAYISGDLLVPGTPTLTLGGHPTVAGTRDGTGAATPANYQVSLDGNALLRYLVRRTDAIALPTVATPPAPTSPHDVTLSGNAGAVAVPAGTYGNLSASGNSALVLGDPNSSTPAVYNVQTLALNGNGQLQIAGPVVINLANGTSLSGEVGNSAHPEWLVLNVAASGVTLNSATVHGSIAAPNGTVTINGNSTLHGGVACDRLVIAGNGLLDGR